MDKSSFLGILIAVGGILSGLLIEGGSVSQILQPTAAMIVLGGTIGAVLLQFPLGVVIQSVQNLAQVFFEPKQELESVIQTLVEFAKKARKDGIVSLDAELPNITNPFLKQSLMLAVDGTEPEELRKIMEVALGQQEEESERIPQVFESAGGFAPTIGIIGAVLGLIQVMQHLDKIEEVGRGIAVAFVATIYGVGMSNLLFLPSAGKLKIRVREETLTREVILEGVVSILEGMNPRMIETKLSGFVTRKKTEAAPAEAGAGAGAEHAAQKA